MPNDIGRFMVAAGAVVELNDTGKILVLKRNSGHDVHEFKWELVYGRIAQGEDVETGLRRELQEEAGLTDVTVNQAIRIWHIYRGEQVPEKEVIGVSYYVSTAQEQIQISNEHLEYRWVAAEEALSLIEVEGIQEDVKRFIELKKNPAQFRVR
jgi:8-oxo-dGTP diphosphatase